jgi:hypothetical protein
MEFTTKATGVKVVINPCSLVDAFRLKSHILKALLDNNIQIEKAIESNVSGLLMALDSSEQVFDSLFECLKKSTYGGVKITKETFESDDAKQDLYEVFYYCLKVNIYPFFKPLLSQLGINLKVPEFGESQK